MGNEKIEVLKSRIADKKELLMYAKKELKQATAQLSEDMRNASEKPLMASIYSAHMDMAFSKQIKSSEKITILNKEIDELEEELSSIETDKMNEKVVIVIIG